MQGRGCPCKSEQWTPANLLAYLAFIPAEAFPNDFSLQCCSFFDGKKVIVGGQAGLTLLVHHEDEFDHDVGIAG